MIEKLINSIDSHQLLKKTDKIGLALSGGRDSVCAAYLLQEAGYHFFILHCNFGLRGEESEGDEAFVRSLGEELKNCDGVVVRKFNTLQESKVSGKSIQETARALRYEFFDELVEEGKIDKVILAHHADDVLETFFINLYRGSGIQGLKSIPRQRGHFIRPFLDYTSAELGEYAKKQKIQWREDSSNSETKYLRNKFRHQVLPSITETISDFSERVLNSISILREEQELMQYFTDDLTKTAVSQDVNKRVEIQKKPLLTYPQAHVILYSILDKYGFNMETCKQILGSKQKGNRFYSSDYVVLDDANVWIIQQNHDRGVESVAVHGEGEYMLGDHIIAIESSTETQVPKERYVELIEYPLEELSLDLRFWQEEDFIQPLGMSGSKLLSDFFTDEKINLFDRAKIPLLCNGREVYWIAGYRISEKVKVRGKGMKYKISLKSRLS
ncbi:tRNA lysidine(34) synthetase TilS [bacterium]|nr:tRNA lysidine(34) synthetase TilS [bacterium]